MGVRSSPNSAATCVGASPVTHSPGVAETMSRNAPIAALRPFSRTRKFSPRSRRCRGARAGRTSTTGSIARYRYRATAYAMKIDHIIVYRDPRPSRVSVPVNTGQASSVIAAGTVPRMRPRTTTLCMLLLGVFRTRHHERTKTRTLENIQTPKNGARYAYVGAMRALGPNAFADMPEMIRFVDVCTEERAHDEGREGQQRAEREDELSRHRVGHSDTISNTPRSTRSG